MRFFERFRRALPGFTEGVHQLEPPAREEAIAATERGLGRPLPPAYREFLLQWNGGWLFHDDYHLRGVGHGEEPTGEHGLVRFGSAPAAALYLDERGRVIAVDEETEARRVEGSDFERWLDATMAREGVLYDREGEFRDEAFDGGELSSKTRRKRAQAAVKADPGSPAWREELAELLVEEGRPEKARAELEAAVAAEPALPSAWFALGKLHRAAGQTAEAAGAFRRAGEVESAPEEAAFFLAHAARAAAEAGQPEPALADRAASLAPTFVAEQRIAAEHLLTEGDAEAALEHLTLALAVSPDDPSLRSLAARARARRSLPTV